jgi:hypothetical protein
MGLAGVQMSPIFVFVGLAVSVPFVSQKFWPATVTGNNGRSRYQRIMLIANE